jgi:hypothetical protein
MDPAEPVPYRGDGINLIDLDTACIEKLVEVLVETPLMHSEIRHLGGAAARSEAHHGSAGTIGAPFTTFSFGLVSDHTLRAEMQSHLAQLHDALAPWDSGTRYMNFCESRTDAAKMFPADSYRRLSVLKRQFDPDVLFAANHPIKPALSGS